MHWMPNGANTPNGNYSTSNTFFALNRVAVTGAQY
jgi:hypothetical protein